MLKKSQKFKNMRFFCGFGKFCGNGLCLSFASRTYCKLSQTKKKKALIIEGKQNMFIKKEADNLKFKENSRLVAFLKFSTFAISYHHF